MDDENEDVFKILNANIKLSELQDYLTIDYPPTKNEVEIRVLKNAELHFTKEKSDSIMQKLDLKESCFLRESQKYKVKPYF